ncbi:MAG: LmeA family phospholipid-binding protein, partial [bacterium]|nr:LmeA family phospholipid-binding protein [bacterium]
KFDNLNAVAKNVNLGGLQASEYLLIAEDVQVNLSAFLANKGINFAKQSSTQITITVTAADFTRFVWEKIHPLNGWRVEINQGNAVVIGTATILNASVPVRITGKFEAWGKDRVSFVPQQLEVQGTLMPQTMLASMFDKSQFYLDLQAVPMKLELTEVLMTPGKLIIKAKSIP